MRSPLATTAIMLAATLAAGCTADAEPDATPTPPPATTAAPVPEISPTPAPSVTDDVHALGDKVSRAAAPYVSAEVLAYRQPVARDAPRPDEAGWVWAAADIRVCATDAAPPGITVADRSWAVTYADGRIISPSSVSYQQFPEPGFPFERVLPAGRCVRGWVTFGVPAGERPAWVEWSAAADPVPIRWVVG